jgi:hypothetical protein
MPTFNPLIRSVELIGGLHSRFVDREVQPSKRKQSHCPILGHLRGSWDGVRKVSPKLALLKLGSIFAAA